MDLPPAKGQLSGMHIFLAILVLTAAALTLLVLGVGLVTFAMGSPWGHRHSTQLMMWRVGLQGLTVLLLGAFLALP